MTLEEAIKIYEEWAKCKYKPTHDAAELALATLRAKQEAVRHKQWEKISSGNWISVKDRLPKPFETVLVHMPGETPFRTVRDGFVTRNGIWHIAISDRTPHEVTHWMPLPEPPKEEV